MVVAVYCRVIPEAEHATLPVPVDPETANAGAALEVRMMGTLQATPFTRARRVMPVDAVDMITPPR
ncbi:MAG TPA: hypothetical protein DEG88_12440 [Propionibacteriaceae bacterium]|nr:hypothetical protein [Propionibacteriaceae bacterium]